MSRAEALHVAREFCKERRIPGRVQRVLFEFLRDAYPAATREPGMVWN